MSRSIREPIAGALAVLTLALLPQTLASADATIATVTQLGHGTYNVNVLIFWGCVAAAHVLFGLMIFSIATAKVDEEVRLRHSTRAEIVWTMIPIIILVALAIPSAQEVIGAADTESSVVTVMNDEQ